MQRFHQFLPAAAGNLGQLRCTLRPGDLRAQGEGRVGETNPRSVHDPVHDPVRTPFFKGHGDSRCRDLLGKCPRAQTKTDLFGRAGQSRAFHGAKLARAFAWFWTPAGPQRRGAGRRARTSAPAFRHLPCQKGNQEMAKRS